MIDMSYRVIADHIRCLTFAINDGCVPDREGRGYVLRRILRRGVRYGWQYMNMHEPFLYKLVPAVVESLGDAFPQLKEKPDKIADIIREEEESFGRTLDRGIALFEEAASDARRRHHNEICGEDAFKLHDTYGFPIDLTQIMAEEQGLNVDIGEYERLMEDARERARGASLGAESSFCLSHDLSFEHVPTATNDSPKYTTQCTTAICRGHFDRDSFLAQQSVQKGQETALILDQTCFYSEQGGQVGDVGTITSDTGLFRVTDTQQRSNVVLHIGHVEEGVINPEQTVRVEVDTSRRSTMQNHTATHVMNWALREVLGEHVQQKGSLVDPDKTRFDLSNPKALTAEQIERVEQLVNEKIAQKLTVYDEPVEQEKALKIHGLRAVFGEKYPDVVRVMSIGTPVGELVANPDNPEWRNISIEFCGGTHCRNTGQIEHFAIVAEEAVAKGIRRVVGVTGETAKAAMAFGAELLKRADDLRHRDRLETGATPDAAADGPATETDLATQVAELQQSIADATLRVVDRIKLREAMSELQKILKQQHKKEAAAASDVVAVRVEELLTTAPKVGDTTIVVAEMPDVPVEQLKTGADIIKQKCGSAAILFGVNSTGKALLLAAMSNDLIKRGVKAGDLVKEVAKLVNGGGGGPPTMAQAGGKNPEKYPMRLLPDKNGSKKS